MYVTCRVSRENVNNDGGSLMLTYTSVYLPVAQVLCGNSENH
jgi:hypothetical protein